MRRSRPSWASSSRFWCPSRTTPADAGRRPAEPAARGGAAGVDVHELENGYRVVVSATDVGNPDVLSTSLARSVGALVLHEAGEHVGAVPSEIAAVVCGFGVLLLNGSAVWAKACGGLRMAQATVLPVEEMAVALALFVACTATRCRTRESTWARRSATPSMWPRTGSSPTPC